ncbi:hypothetical protein [Micromonospora sp. NPDC047740]|uniref:hypothetical protein n=1 Tax=Micromonospora sp. NPDC047740 TaxID=3364254 RepID=UPI00372027C0
MRHLAAEHGIAVVTVPARNTSKHCPQCITPLQHRKAPTSGPSRGGSGPSGPTSPAVGRATATTAPGGASPPADSPTRPKPSPTRPPAPW